MHIREVFLTVKHKGKKALLVRKTQELALTQTKDFTMQSLAT